MLYDEWRLGSGVGVEMVKIYLGRIALHSAFYAQMLGQPLVVQL